MAYNSGTLSDLLLETVGLLSGVRPERDAELGKQLVGDSNMMDSTPCLHVA